MLNSTQERIDTVLMMENSHNETNYEESLSHYIKAQIISKDQVKLMINKMIIADPKLKA